MLALGATVVGQRQTQQRMLEEIRGLKESMAERSASPGDANIVEALPSSRDSALLREMAELRGEVAALRQELSETVRAAVSAIPSAAPTVAVPTFVKSGWVDTEGLPPQVLATLREQLGSLPIDGASMKRSEGRQYYRVDTHLPDGRAVELSVNDQGKMVGRVVEMSLDSLDQQVRQQALAEVGTVPVRRVAEVFEDGQIRYQVVAKDENQAVHVLVAPDGRVLRTAIERRDKKS